MPYKSEKIIIANTKHDGRIKLTEEDKKEIIELYPEIKSQRKLADMFGVSRRTIQFILDPKKLEENKKRRQERGGTAIYYDREKNRKAIANNRNKKQELYLKGEISLPK